MNSLYHLKFWRPFEVTHHDKTRRVYFQQFENEHGWKHAPATHTIERVLKLKQIRFRLSDIKRMLKGKPPIGWDVHHINRAEGSLLVLRYSKHHNSKVSSAIHSCPPIEQTRQSELVRFLEEQKIEPTKWKETAKAKHNGHFESWKSALFRSYAQYLILQGRKLDQENYTLQAYKKSDFLQKLLFPIIEEFNLNSDLSLKDNIHTLIQNIHEEFPYFSYKEIFRVFWTYVKPSFTKDSKASTRAVNTLA